MVQLGPIVQRIISVSWKSKFLLEYLCDRLGHNSLEILAALALLRKLASSPANACKPTPILCFLCTTSSFMCFIVVIRVNVVYLPCGKILHHKLCSSMHLLSCHSLCFPLASDMAMSDLTSLLEGRKNVEASV